jgi:hypothetical protein
MKVTTRVLLLVSPLLVVATTTAGCGSIAGTETESASNPASADGIGKLAGQGGGFSASCPNEWLTYNLGPYHTPVILGGRCYNNVGNLVDGGQIHLDWVVTNNNGNMNWHSSGYGGFQNTCGSCSLDWYYNLFGVGIMCPLTQICNRIENDYCPADNCWLVCGIAGGNGTGNGCQKADKSWQSSDLNLNDCIANYNGRLTYIC